MARRRPRPVDLVDRAAERRLFRSMLRQDSGHRILVLNMPDGFGKTSLLSRFSCMCHHYKHPHAYVDFRQVLFTGVSYLDLARRVVRQIGQKRLASTQSLLAGSSRPLIAGPSNERAGDGGVTIGQETDFSRARYTSIIGRDKIGVQINNVHWQLSPEEVRRQRQDHAEQLGDALCRDLYALTSRRFLGRRRAAILLDNYHDAPVTTRRWIEQWLLHSMLDGGLDDLILVLATDSYGLDIFYSAEDYCALLTEARTLRVPAPGDRDFLDFKQDIRSYMRIHGLDAEDEEIARELERAASRSMFNLCFLRDLLKPGCPAARQRKVG